MKTRGKVKVRVKASVTAAVMVVAAVVTDDDGGRRDGEESR